MFVYGAEIILFSLLPKYIDADKSFCSQKILFFKIFWEQVLSD
jgi:hypothetical protein